MAKFRTSEGFESSGTLNVSVISGSRIISATELVLSSSTGRTINSGGFIVPVGGGINHGGNGIAIGSPIAYESLFIKDGNAWLQGVESSYTVQATDITNFPSFQWGRMIIFGDGSPGIRFVYFDDVTPQRTVFAVDNKGIFASVRQSSGSHWEGFIENQIQPFFRLSSYPSMSLEMGRGNNNDTDIVLRRSDVGRLKIISQLSGGVPVTGNLDVANIYSSDGHLHLSSAFGVVAISGNLIVPSGNLGVGTNNAQYAIHVVSGNMRIEGGLEYGYQIKRNDLPNSPTFDIGRIILGGDLDPEMRFIYHDNVTTDRSVFEFDKKGIVASVKPTGSYGSHFEGFIAGDVEPLFRLNSSPSMSFEAGRGSGSWTDAILRRVDIGRFKIHSQLSGGAYSTASLDVANLYSSDGHLHLSSTLGVVAISGNLKVNSKVYSPTHLIFSSSVGSTTAVSGNLKMAGNGILNSDTDLLLSSSNSLIVLSGNVKLVGQIYNDTVPTLTTLSKSVSLDFNRGHSFIIDTSGSITDITASLSNMKAGNSYIVKVKQGDVSYRNLVFTPTPKYSSGSVPVFSSGSGKEDIATIWYDGVNSYLNFGPWFF